MGRVGCFQWGPCVRSSQGFGSSLKVEVDGEVVCFSYGLLEQQVKGLWVRH